jgi:hypothetical protein
MRPVRDEALALLRAFEAGLSGFRLTGRTTCLAWSRKMLGGREGDIAIRPLMDYLATETRAVDGERRA